MNWLGIVESLIPSLVEIVKDAIDTAKGNEEVAKGILMGILGTSPENQTRIAIVVARAKAEATFGNLTQ